MVVEPNPTHPSVLHEVKLLNSINKNNKNNCKIGQVSLPVLSRKGKHDYWNYNWIDFKNYSLNFNEDIFLQKFFFMFFMYNVSFNKHFTPIYFKKEKNRKKYFNLDKYLLGDHNLMEINNQLMKTNKNKFYISKMYLCKSGKWVFIYMYIYSITNLRVKVFKKNITLDYGNYNTLYHTYLLNRYKYNQKQIIFLKKTYQ